VGHINDFLLHPQPTTTDGWAEAFRGRYPPRSEAPEHRAPIGGGDVERQGAVSRRRASIRARLHFAKLSDIGDWPRSDVLPQSCRIIDNDSSDSGIIGNRNLLFRHEW
jgi:hypothetical protein